MDSEWIVVTKKSKCSAKSTYTNSKKHKTLHQVSNILLDKQKLKMYSDLVLGSRIYQQARESLVEQIAEVESKGNGGQSQLEVAVNILGIGNFVEYKKPYLQYLLIKEVIQFLKEKGRIGVRVNAYDPVFTAECREVLLKSFPSITFQPTNQPQTPQAHTQIRLYYMIHCQRELYSSILSTQTKSNNKLIIIGNSLQQYNDRLSLLGKEKESVFETWSLTQRRLDDFQEAFNDTYFMFK